MPNASSTGTYSCGAVFDGPVMSGRWGDAARAKATKMKIFLLSKLRVHILILEHMHGGLDENNT